MLSQPPEDLQPNEIHQSRRRNPIVPAVLTARPKYLPSSKESRQPYRHFRSIPDGAPAALPNRLHPRGQGRYRNHDKDTRSQINLIAKEKDHRSTQKRATFVEGSSRDNAVELEARSIRQQCRDSPNRNDGDESVDLSLPPECRKGAPGSRLRRNEWVTEQILSLEAERNATVVGSSLFRNSVRLLYRPGISLSGTQDKAQTTNTSLKISSTGAIAETPRSEDPKSHIISSSPPKQSLLRDGPQEIVEILGPLYPPARFHTGTLKLFPSVPRLHGTHILPNTPIAKDNLTNHVVRQSTTTPFFAAATEDTDTHQSFSSDEEIDELSAGCDQVIRLTRNPSDKPRRVMVGPRTNSQNEIFSVTMRGAMSSVLRSNTRYSVHELLPGMTGPRGTIDDACLISAEGMSYVVTGHVRDVNEIGLFQVKQQRAKHIQWLSRPLALEPGGKQGISTICAMLKPAMFASGGYDHRVHLWTVPSNPSKTTSEALRIEHNSVVQALLPIKDTSHKLVTGGADCKVNVFDLSSERVVNSFKTSNHIFHLHPSPSEFCTLVEVAHRDLQFEIRDRRIIAERTVQRFGYHSANFHSRHMKGSTQSNFFASGDSSGSVRIWDYRKLPKPVSEINVFNHRKIKQVVFNDSELVVCSEDHHLKLLPMPSLEAGII